MSRHQEMLGRPLSTRERQAVEYVAQGLKDDEICALMYVSRPTLRRYLEIARAKLGARNRTHAAVLAVVLKLIEVKL